MIELSIRDERPDPEVEKEYAGVLYLERCPDGSGDINLMIKNMDDNFDWFIMRLKADGTFSRTSGISIDIGLQIDSDSKIMESEE